MTRLLVHVEGETEETFVNELLRPHLYARGYTSVAARLIGNARLRERRGGTRSWDTVRKDIIRHLRGDIGTLSTSMVDYYALPAIGGGAWPGRATASSAALTDKASAVEDAMKKDIEAEAGVALAERFIPNVVMHEFEGLLFSDCGAFSRGIYQPSLESRLQAIRDAFSSPEDINDSVLTAPSKRVVSLIPSYQKPLMGTLAALEVGLATIRKECPHFDTWLRNLESLATVSLTPREL